MEYTKKKEHSLMNSAAEFVKTLNLAIPSFDLTNINQLEQLQNLQNKAKSLQNLPKF